MKSPITYLTGKLGIHKQELFMAAIVLFGVLIGSVIRATGIKEAAYKAEQIEKAALVALVDSIALAEQSVIAQQPSSSAGMLVGTASAESTVSADTERPKKQSKEEALKNRRIELNSATEAELMLLPGVGEKMAATIIEQRKVNPFQRPEDLMRIKGIGEKKFAKLQPYITVRPR